MDDLTDDVIPEDTWVPLAELLSPPRGANKSNITVAILKDVIEAEGVRTHDQWGKLIPATEGDEQELTSKARAYKLLAAYYAEIRAYDEFPPGWHTDSDPDRWLEHVSPLNDFGWPKDEVPDFADWVAKSLSKSKKTPSTVLEDAKSSDWKMNARKIASEYIAHHKAQDLFPSQADVCKHVEKIMRDEKIYGIHRKPLKNGYIMRNAIGGEWWKKNKP